MRLPLGLSLTHLPFPLDLFLTHPQPSPRTFPSHIPLTHVFYGAIRRYWPGLQDHTLAPDYSGVRPKLAVPRAVVGAEAAEAAEGTGSHPPHGRDLDDFVVEGPRAHGIRGLVNLFGIESPGLTASLAIAKRVVCLLNE